MDSVGSPSSKAERPEFLIGAHTRMHSLPIRFVFTFSQKLRIKKISMDYGIIMIMIGKENDGEDGGFFG